MTEQNQTFDPASFTYLTWEQGADGVWQQVEKQQSYQIEQWYTSETELPYTVQEWEKTLKKVTYTVHHTEWVKKEVMGSYPVFERYKIYYGQTKYVYEMEYVPVDYTTALIGKVLKTVDYSTTILGTETKELTYDTPQIATVTNQLEYEVTERSQCEECPSDWFEDLPLTLFQDLPVPDLLDLLSTESVLPNFWQPTSGWAGAEGIPYSTDHDLSEFLLSLGSSSFGNTITGSLIGGWQLSDSDGGSSGTEPIAESATGNPTATGEYPGTRSGDDGNRYLLLGDSGGTGGRTGLSGGTAGRTTATPGGNRVVSVIAGILRIALVMILVAPALIYLVVRVAPAILRLLNSLIQIAKIIFYLWLILRAWLNQPTPFPILVEAMLRFYLIARFGLSIIEKMRAYIRSQLRDLEGKDDLVSYCRRAGLRKLDEFLAEREKELRNSLKRLKDLLGIDFAQPLEQSPQ